MLHHEQLTRTISSNDNTYSYFTSLRPFKNCIADILNFNHVYDSRCGLKKNYNNLESTVKLRSVRIHTEYSYTKKTDIQTIINF